METYDTWSWTQTYSSTPGWLIVLVSILLLVTLVMWIFLPFAIYGVKTILRQQNAHLAETHLLLTKVLKEIQSRGSADQPSSSAPPPTT